MIEFEQNMPCDLIMGFSLDLLMDLVSLNIKQIKIDNTSVGVISNSNKYVFSLYFQSGSDCVVINKPHGIKIIDAKLLETVAWGSSSLRSGSVTQVLKFSHHYLVDYVMSVDPGKKSFIILKYNGTAIEVVEGGALGDIPVKMIRQVIQSSMNTNPVPSVELEHPSINIPFADTAVDFKRLKFFGNGEGKDKSPLYFDAVVNGRKYMLGQVENNANGLVDLKRTSILKRDDMPLTISVQGQKIDCNTRTASLIGKAVNVHEDYNDTQLYSLTGSDPVSETEICGELTNVKIKHVYNNVQLLINPILERFGVKMKSLNEIKKIVGKCAGESSLTLKPNYILVYGIRDFKPKKISTEFLGVLLEPETNSFCLKFNYAIDGVEDCPAKMTSASGFVYPYGVGLMASENLLSKIFQAYWNFSSVLPGTFSIDSKKLQNLRPEDAAWFYSLNAKSPELMINESKLKVSTIIDTDGNQNGTDKAEIDKINKADADGKKEGGKRDAWKTKPVDASADPKFSDNKKQGIAEAGIKLSDKNEIELDIGKLEFNENAGPLTELANIPSDLFDNIISFYDDAKIKMLKIPDEFTVAGESYKISYNSVNVGREEVVVGSKVTGIRKFELPSRPTLPLTQSMSDVDFVVPKEKWGYEGVAKGQFNIPCGIALISVNGVNHIYSVDRDNNRVQKFSTKGECLGKWGSSGSEDGQFNYPNGISVDIDGNVYVVDAWNNRVQKFDMDGTFIAKFGSNGSSDGKFFFPQGIVVDKKGNVYVTDSNHFVHKFKPDFNYIKKWGGNGNGNGKFTSPRGMAMDEKDCLYVADAGNHRIQKFNSNGKFLMKWGSTGQNDGEFLYPQGIALDSEGNVFVTDTGNNRIQKFSPKGEYISQFSCEGLRTGQVSAPWDIAVDDKGDIFVSDSFNNRIQKFGS